MKILYLSMVIFFLSISTTISAHLSGTYEIKGFDPLLKAEYKGILVIEKVENSVFRASWFLTEGVVGTATGTGVRKDNCISFVFTESDTAFNSTGTQLYQIEKNVLKGPWVRLGAT